MKNKIVVISPFYNAVDAIERNIVSVLGQKYDDFEAVFVNDGSIDGTLDKIKELLDFEGEENVTGVTGLEFTKHNCSYKGKTRASKITVLNRPSRVTALPNWTDAIFECCDTEDVVVSLDGDDWFINKKVLNHVDEMYNTHNCWFTYGGCSWTDGRSCCSMPYNENDFKSLRTAHFKVSQMRTYRAGLFHKIKEVDSNFSCFKDGGGNFYTSACDVALAYPILEMCGLNKIHHNTKPVYIYNRNNPINDDKVDQQKQWDIHADILKKESFKKLESYA